MQHLQAAENFIPLSSGANSLIAKTEITNNLDQEQILQQEQQLLYNQYSIAGGFVINKSADYTPQLEKAQVPMNFNSVNHTIPRLISINTLSIQFTPITSTSTPDTMAGFPNANMNNFNLIFHPTAIEQASTFNFPLEINQTHPHMMNMSSPKPNVGWNQQSCPLGQGMANPLSSNMMVAPTSALDSEDALPGETMKLKAFGTIYPHQYSKLVADGSFLITNFKFLFKPHSPNFLAENKLQPDYFQVPLGLFLSADKKNDRQNPSVSYVDVYCKDGRSFKIKFNASEADRIQQVLQAYSAIERKDDYFAFEFFKFERELEEKYKGWQVFDIFREFQRQGIEAEPTKDMIEDYPSLPSVDVPCRFKYVDNRGGKICSTYPPYFIVPARIKDSVIQRCAQFRSRERLPILSYYYRGTEACMYRSAQPKPGLYSNRSPEDEVYLQYLGKPNLNEDSFGNVLVNNEINLQIYDARPYLAALANKAKGKGFEDIKNYKNCEIAFMQIENIHHVRESYKKLMALCYNSDVINRKWLQQLEGSDWLDMISYILTAGVACAQNLLEGKNCLVHCSDGWDRTAQITAIAQILLDPYFRTIEGFEVLIEKEFLSYGFQAQLRLGIGPSKEKADEQSPVLLQFLDCVHQLIHQFPFVFEYNTRFLQEISYHSYSCQFGTFLNNCYIVTNFYDLPYSMLQNSKWSKASCLDSSGIKILKPNVALKFMRVWEEYYMYYSLLASPPFDIEPEIKFFSEIPLYLWNKEKQKGLELEMKIMMAEEELKRCKENAKNQEMQ